ncbi:hypothetical protein BC829DRAFT_18212 [Chytridium lagenaria]|nr:hypothetical protein BC829DRAFT_18212 [Chytridium lagenaria]
MGRRDSIQIGGSRMLSRRNTVSSFRIAQASESSWTVSGPSQWSKAEIVMFVRAVGETEDKVDALLHVLRVDTRQKRDQKEEALDLGEVSSCLESIALKTLGFFYNSVTASRPILLVDDCQFLDSSSAQVLQALLSQNTIKMCIIMFSRPLDNYPFAEAMGKIRLFPFVQRVELKGLSENDIEKYITWKLDVKDVVIGPNVVSSIKERSKGNPIFVEFLVNIVAWRRDRLQYIGDTQAMSFTFSATELTTLLSCDVAEAINVNFDKVHADLQELLKVVSIFGMQFNLEEVCAIWNPSLTRQNLIQIITSHDKYSFLLPTSSKDAGFEGDSISDAMYGFRHQTIMEAIYERIPYSFRTDMHFRIGNYFEDRGCDSIHLPLLCYHYSRSNNYVKKLHYLEKLCFFYSENFPYPNAFPPFPSSQNLLTRTMRPF